MANVKISQLPNLGNLASGTQFPVANAGNTFSVTSDTIKAYVVGSGFSVGNSIISNVAEPVANSDAATKSYVDSATSSGFTIQDDTANTTVVSGGDTLQLYGTANEVTVAITVADQVTFGLPDNVSVTSNITAGGNVYAPAIVQNASTFDTSIGLSSATGLVLITSNGNSTQFKPSGQIEVSGASQVVGGSFSGSGITLGGSQTDLFQNRGGNVTVQVGTGGSIANTWTFAQNGSFTSPGAVSATGNVTGGNLTTGGLISATGNITGGNLSGTNIAGTLTTAAQTNITSVGTLTALTVTGNASTGNVSGTAGTFTNVTGTLQTAAQTNITSVGTLGALSVTGNITGGNLLVNADTVITGNLTVNGTTTTINSNTITTNDLAITLGNNQSTGAALNGAGIDIGNNGLATWKFNNATTSWQSNIAVMPTANGTLTLGGTSNYWGAAYVTSLTATGNIAGGNLSGTNIAGTLSTAAQTNITSVGTLGSLSVTGNVSTGNVSGTTGTFTNVAGTLSTASQTNITAVGTLTNLTVTNAISGSVTGSAATVTGAAQANITSVGTLTALTVTGNVSAGNLSGTNIAGTLSTAAQTNITSVGTLGSLSVTGNVSTGNVSGTTGTFTNVAGTLTTASQTNITGVGALNAGSITSGFGAIDIGTDSLTVGSIINANANGVGNIGSSSTQFNTVFAKATSAQYADLAEKYTADADYAPGTVVKFGGSAEITVCDHDHDPEIAGVVSTNPAYIMNAGLQGEHVVSVALTGRVPCHVQGPVRRGQMLVSAGNGRARAETHPAMGTVIGKALEDFNGDIGTIEAVVGRL